MHLGRLSTEDQIRHRNGFGKPQASSAFPDPISGEIKCSNFMMYPLKVVVNKPKENFDFQQRARVEIERSNISHQKGCLPEIPAVGSQKYPSD